MRTLRRLAASLACWTAMADGPQTNVITTTRDPNSKPACGCTTTSFVLLRAESADSPVVRQNSTTFHGSIFDMTSGLSQEACEATLLTSVAVAYSYNFLTESCVLFTQLTESVSAPSIRSGAKIQELPWQCHLACIAYADPRWTGVVRINVISQSCQCCFNEDVVLRPEETIHYGCSASGCGDSWCGPSLGSSNSASKTTRWLLLAAFLRTFVE